MSEKQRKQFGVWMDTHHATIVGRKADETREFFVLGHIENPGADNNSNEQAAQKQEMGLTHKFFKEIAHLMPNIEEIHVTGTGKIQEEFIHYLAATAQYKNADTSDSTSNKMSDAALTAYFTKYFG
ncbi:MAG: hypothetical protein JNJ58_14395 [Chitinophagaceae bacterium]|nr:hypothetical protein [Chitinophagaceae bacterium]